MSSIQLRLQGFDRPVDGVREGTLIGVEGTNIAKLSRCANLHLTPHVPS